MELKLKKRAQVIFLNNDRDNRWVNGTVGVIDEIEDEFIRVRLKDDQVHCVNRHVWKNETSTYCRESFTYIQKVLGTFEQFPLRLAWALTIHKAQGITLDKVIVDLGNGAFTEGQTYTALARVRKLEELYVKRPTWQSDLKINHRVQSKYLLPPAVEVEEVLPPPFNNNQVIKEP